MSIRACAAAIVLLASVAHADPPKRPLSELVNSKEPAWPNVKKWIAEAKVDVKVLPVARADGEKTLLALQVTTRSPMGAIALESCGLIVDRGWLRILGGGCPAMENSLATFNALDKGAQPALVVAYDAIGGVYAVNAGGFDGKPGNVYYFGPHTLRWEDLDVPYTHFLLAALAGKLSKADEPLRWKGWEKDVAALKYDDAISIAPPLWTKQGRTEKVSRRPLPAKELLDFEMDIARQLDGAAATGGTPAPR